MQQLKVSSLIKPIVVLYLLLIAINFQVCGQDIRIMSLNIRYNNPGDGINSWMERRAEVVDLIDYYHPDILGLQEGLQDQLTYIDGRLADYTMFGVGREDGKQKGEYTAIFYDSAKYQLISQNTFWLSESPEEVSIGWDAALERICTYGVFKIKKSDQSLYVFNAHFDHVGKEAQRKSAELIIQKIEEIVPSDSAIILMGDLNCEPGSPPIEEINKRLEDGLSISDKSLYGPLGTFNGFDTTRPLTNRIDYIFTRNIKVLSYRHIDDRRKNKGFISDHLPVFMQSKMAIDL